MYEQVIILKVLNSPFKPFKLKFYFDKIAIGTPLFLPRTVVKSKTKPGYLDFVPIKWFGINFIGLGWKTKWELYDYRFEWEPMLSIVLFGKQFCIIVNAPEAHNYWEAWLYYELNTDKSKSQEERIKKCIAKFPMIWTVYEGENKVIVNKYNSILKDKYLKFIPKI